jgi:serine/threonine protein kinase
MPAEPSPTDALVGRVLAERYQILHRLGEGAMGVVYKARHVKVGRTFAVKVLHPRALEDSKVVTRFEREAELAGRLRHPNVIGVVDVGEVDGTRYMVMDFVEGPDLARLLDEAPMPGERIIRLVRQMLEGLHHAHEAGLIHRDFKPENVIVERDSHGGELPRIVDFGIALLREGTGAGDGQGRLTTSGLVLGTPHYMAPEQAVADPIDHRIDLFALGIVIYEMLSGRLPFDGSGAEVARANLLIDPPPISKRVPHLEVDPLLEAFARKLMHKKRDARPATARAARELLDLIDRDRMAAAIALGVPVARSGRQPAETERVDADHAPPDATARMKPTPRGSEPALPAPRSDAALPASPPPPLPTGMGVPAWMAPAAEMSPPAGAVGVAIGYPGEAGPPLAFGPPGSFAPPQGLPIGYPGTPPPNAYAPHAPPQRHRDTGLRTPLGWQTASHPARRRRSWLLGSAALVAAGIVAAVAITWSSDRDAASPGLTVATPGPIGPPPSERSAAAAPAIPAPSAPPTSAPAPNEPATSAATAAPSAASPSAPPSAPNMAPPPIDTAAAAPAAPARSPSDTRRTALPSRRSKPASPRPEPASPAAQRAADSSPPGPEPAAEVRRPAEPSRVDRPAERPAEPLRVDRPAERPAEPPRVDRPAEPPPTEHAAPAAAAPPAGTTANALGVLFDQVKHEIEAIPTDRQKELLDQLAMIGVTRAMIGSQFQRDEAAAKLARLRMRVRERMAH